jgi:hypothetical protein
MKEIKLKPLTIWMLLLGIVLYVVHIVFAGVSHRVLYPDGSIYVTYLLESGETIWWHWHRYFAYKVQHFPMVTMVNSGMTDWQSMISVHSTWYHSFAFISLVACWFILPKDKKQYVLFPLISTFAIYMNVEFFPITPGRFLVAIYWILIFLILFRKGWLPLLLTIVVAIPTLRSYQGMLFLGLPLIYTSFQRFLNEDSKMLKIIWVAVTIWFVSGIVIAIVSILQPQDPTSFITFILGLLLFVDEEFYPHFPFLLSGYFLFILFRAKWKKEREEQVFKRHLPIFLVLSFLVLFMPQIFPESLAPETHQQVRSLNIYLNMGLGFILIFALKGKIEFSAVFSKYAFLMISILAIVQCLWNIQATNHWNRYRHILSNEIEKADPGVLFFMETDMPNLREKHGLSNGIHNDWATGYLSIYTNPKTDIETLMAHSYDNLFRPIDVRDSTELPDLSKYGIKFTIFRKGLGDQLQSGKMTIPYRPLPDIAKWFETDTVGVNNYFEEPSN